MPFKVEMTQDLVLWDPLLSTNAASGVFTLPVKQNRQGDYQFYRAVLYPKP